MKKNITLFALSVFTAITLLTASVSAAGTASFSLSPSASSITNGSTLHLSIFENGTDVNVVTAKLAYDAGKLFCDNSSVSGSSAFAGQVTVSCGGGNATISRYASPGSPALSGNQLVGIIAFKSISQGTANISIAPGSQIASNGTNTWNGVLTSTAVTVVAPAATSGAKPKPSSQQSNASTTVPAATTSNGVLSANEASAEENETADSSSVAAKPSDSFKKKAALLSLVAAAAAGTYLLAKRQLAGKATASNKPTAKNNSPAKKR